MRLATRWRDHAVHVAAQDPSGELDHGVAEVDDGAAGHRPDVDPVRGVWEQHLEAADAVEEDGKAAKVGVFAEREGALVGWLRWRADEADVAA